MRKVFWGHRASSSSTHFISRPAPALPFYPVTALPKISIWPCTTLKFLSVFLLPFTASSHNTLTSMLSFSMAPPPPPPCTHHVPSALLHLPLRQWFMRRGAFESPKLSIISKTAANTRIILGNWNRVNLITLCMPIEHLTAVNEGKGNN